LLAAPAVLAQREASRLRPARWYSADAPTKPTETPDGANTSPEEQIAAESQGKADAPDATAELQKKLDDKDAEARDWKVGLPCIGHRHDFPRIDEYFVL
jgi:hypothetical protein